MKTKTLFIIIAATLTLMAILVYMKETVPLFHFLVNTDKGLMLFLNFDGGTVMDKFWYIVSSRTACIPVALAFIYYMVKDKERRKYTLLAIISIALVVTLADQISSSLIKPLVGRLRPSRSEDIAPLLHYVNNHRGGLYGFVSSHAANTFGVFVYVSLLLKKRYITFMLLAWTLLICYSRIYLGVHYPGDIICGCALGALIGYVIYKLNDPFYRWFTSLPIYKKITING